MGGQRLFVLQVVMAQEDLWFAPDTDGPPIRSRRQHYIESALFAAKDAEEAYRLAQESLRGYSDANHDGSGDLTRFFALGIHQLEELIERPEDLPVAVCGPYGVQLGLHHLADVGAEGVPLIRPREQLDAFKYPSGPPPRPERGADLEI
jgi:hypothetical protein